MQLYGLICIAAHLPKQLSTEWVIIRHNLIIQSMQIGMTKIYFSWKWVHTHPN